MICEINTWIAENLYLVPLAIVLIFMEMRKIEKRIDAVQQMLRRRDDI